VRPRAERAGNCPISVWAEAPMSGKVVRAADVRGVSEPQQLSPGEPSPPSFPEAGSFPRRLRTPLRCSRWVQHPGTSTAMGTSLRTPSFSSCSSSSTDTDDEGMRGTCEDASLCRGACGARGQGPASPGGWGPGGRRACVSRTRLFAKR